MTLTDERRKALTLYLSECWHDMPGQEVFSCLKGGFKNDSNCST